MGNGYLVVSCPRCGGNDFNTDLNTGTKMCKYCNTTFVPNPENEHTSIKKLDNAELYFHKFNDSNVALRYYNEALELDPGNFRGWWGLAKVKTNNFEEYLISKSTYNEVKDYVEKAVLTSTAEVKEGIREIFNEYTDKYNERLKQRENDIKNRIKDKEQEKTDISKRLNPIKSEIILKQEEEAKIRSEISSLESGINSNKLIEAKGLCSSTSLYIALSFLAAPIIFLIFRGWIGIADTPAYGFITNLGIFLLCVDGIIFIVSLLVNIICHLTIRKNKKLEANIKEKKEQLTELNKKIDGLNKQKDSLKQSINELNSTEKVLENEFNNL